MCEKEIWTIRLNWNGEVLSRKKASSVPITLDDLARDLSDLAVSIAIKIMSDKEDFT